MMLLNTVDLLATHTLHTHWQLFSRVPLVSSRYTCLNLSFRGVMSFEAGTFGCAGITAVGASISFSEVYGTNSTDMVTVNHLILGHALEL